MFKRTASALLATLFIVGCSDENTLVPNTETVPDGPGFAIVDAGNGGVIGGFWFLPPMAKQVGTEGILDNDLDPAMWVCQLEPLEDGSYPADPNDWGELSCTEEEGETVVFTEFPAGSAELTPDTHYQFSWDTSFPESSENLRGMDPERFYRIHVEVSDSVLGFFDVNPQRPSGESPGDDVEGLYAFRLGENLPVKVFITSQVRCATAQGYVIQCIAEGVIDQTGGTVTLDPEETGWVTISTHFQEGSLPNLPDGTPLESIIVQLERIDPVEFTSLTGGEYCIPGLDGITTAFDAPLFDDCLRVTTIPELPAELLSPAVVEICIAAPTVEPQQLLSMQIIRFDDDDNVVDPGDIEGLQMLEEGNIPPGFFSTCLPEGFSLLHEPDDGVFRLAARAVNSVARLFAPEPLMAHGEISLGGLMSEFSRFQWGLPGQMLYTENWTDQTEDVGEPAVPTVVIQQDAPGVSYDLDVELVVMDAGAVDVDEFLVPEPVAGATVHFENDVDVTTCYDADPDPYVEDWQGACAASPVEDGLAGTTWNLPTQSITVGGTTITAPPAGDYTFGATALGLLSTALPEYHDGAQTFSPATLTFYAKVVGLPEVNLETTDLPGPVPPGHTYEDLTITVTDGNGDYVEGFRVTWATDVDRCDVGTDPACDEGSAVGPGGETSGNLYTSSLGEVELDWTISTIPGLNTLTIWVNGESVTLQVANYTATGGCLVTVDGYMDDGEWDCATVETFSANVSGGSPDNAEVMWQTDGTDLFMLVRVKREREDKVNSLRIDFLNDPTGCADGTECDPAAGDDAIGFDFSEATSGAVELGNGEAYFHFLDEYLTDRCANRSQAGCGTEDTRNRDNPGTEDGAGAHQNGLYDGEYWNVYELSHPLNSGDPNDFVRSLGEGLGFYLTMQVGNGAQGNTQWPGFRTYRVITIQ